MAMNSAKLSGNYGRRAKYGGQGITIPSKICEMQYQNSQLNYERRTNKVIDQDIVFHNDLSKHTRRIKQSIKNVKTNFYKEQLENLKRQMNKQNKLRALEDCLEKGASPWINVNFLLLILQGRRNTYYASIGKSFASDVANKNATDCVQVPIIM